MKQTIKFICSILLLGCLFVASNVQATTKGSSETFNVNVTSKSNIQSGAISLTYDKNALELTNAAWTITGTLMQDFNTTTNDGVFACTNAQVVGGNIFTMTFKVKDTANIGKYEIGVIVKLVDTSNQASTQNKTYTINVECTHDYTAEVQDDKYLKSQATCSTPKTYFKSCRHCGEKGTATFTVGSTLEHNFNFQNETPTYLAKPGTCTTRPVYYYACSGCGKASTTTYEGTAMPAHDFNPVWTSTNVVHYHTCKYCSEMADVAPHTPGAEPTETTPQTCTVCGYEIKPMLGHTHNYDTTSYRADETSHWYECGCGAKAEVNPHTYDNTCDTNCNACGYVREANHSFGNWISDDNSHWKVCSCGEIGELEAHTFTGDKQKTCVICNHVLKEEVTHTHKFGSKWESNDVSHWHKCNCGEKADFEEHQYDEGIIIVDPTTDEEGVKRYMCKCGYEKLELVPRLEKEEGCKAGLPITLTIIGVLLAAAAVGAVVYIKKRENNE